MLAHTDRVARPSALRDGVSSWKVSNLEETRISQLETVRLKKPVNLLRRLCFLAHARTLDT
jgi:hypothetical protein